MATAQATIATTLTETTGRAAGPGAQVDFMRYPARSVARAFRRLHCLHRLWRLSTRGARRGRTGRQLLSQVVAETRRGDPGLKISPRSLQVWEQLYRQAESEGLPGVVGLIDRYSRVSGATVAADGNTRRSPEAVACFLALHYGRKKLSIHRCHTLTLSAAARCGWCWPKSPHTTRSWLKRIEKDTGSTPEAG